MTIQSAPTGNGIMELTEAQIIAIRDELRLINSVFEPDMYSTTCTIQHMVAEYNAGHVGAEINGDTASMCYGYMTEAEIQAQPQP